MKRLLPLLMTLPLLADIDIRGNVSLQGDAFLNHQPGKHENAATLMGSFEAEYTYEDFRAVTRINAQQDYYDLQAKEEQTGRSFLRVDEFYGTLDLGDNQLMAGRSLRFWGALEVRNIVDGFNPVDLRNGLFEEDKIGVWNAALTHYTDTGSLSLIVKFAEEEQKMAKAPYAFYFFPPEVRYDAALQTSESDTLPTYYLRLGGSTETEYPLDYAVILQRGYDSQRYFLAGDPVITPIDLITYTYTVPLAEHAYRVNKAMTYDTLVVGDTLFKLEALFADVIDDDRISDYYHVAAGMEHTVVQVYGEADLGLLAEYYRYETTEKGKYTDLDLFEVFQNDLFLGLRISLNDVNSASLVGGVVADLEYDEQSYYAEYETRLFDSFKLNVDYRYIEPSKNTMTAFHMLGRFQSITAKFGYYF
ncbi:hypothetical protein WCX49_01410 [Sulfurimonas sp. HSL-1656]|uniref:hypothetical protein n=1 Tax=Thiomicrolovo subterrani TaxID=3131934 RepID=UPI0031F73EB0